MMILIMIINPHDYGWLMIDTDNDYDIGWVNNIGGLISIVNYKWFIWVNNDYLLVN